jgi:drug/metabolite transporter (DMT)-like permease
VLGDDLACPVAMIDLVVAAGRREWSAVSWESWAVSTYAGVVNMFLGSVAWYEGLAADGDCAHLPTQSRPPIVACCIGVGALLLGEPATWAYFATCDCGLAVDDGLASKSCLRHKRNIGKTIYRCIMTSTRS